MAKLILATAVVLLVLAYAPFGAAAQHRQESKPLGSLINEGKKTYPQLSKNRRDIGGYGGSERSMEDPGVAGVPGGHIGRGALAGEQRLPDNVMRLRE